MLSDRLAGLSTGSQAWALLSQPWGCTEAASPQGQLGGHLRLTFCEAVQEPVPVAHGHRAEVATKPEARATPGGTDSFIALRGHVAAYHRVGPRGGASGDKERHSEALLHPAPPNIPSSLPHTQVLVHKHSFPGHPPQTSQPISCPSASSPPNPFSPLTPSQHLPLSSLSGPSLLSLPLQPL